MTDVGCSYRLTASQSQVRRVELEKAGVEQRLAEAQRKGMQEEARELQQSLRMRDSVQLVETAVQERDQVTTGNLYLM